MNVNSGLIARRCVVLQVIAIAVFATILFGCGPALSPVKGTVTYNGQKVKGGMLIFSPVADGAGAPSAATIQEDGSFELKSGNSAGAVLGKATVTYSPPSAEPSTDPGKNLPGSIYGGLVPKDATVEVKSGANNLTIELVKGK